MEDNRSVLTPRLNWGDRVEPDGEFLLPVGTVTLLLADVEGSTRRWQDDEAAMAKAMAELRDLVGEIIGRHHGVRPLDQGEGDSFFAAFARPSEAVACALDIQRSAELPLRIGIHVGEAQRTEEGNYVGPALSRTARIRDAAHGGQVVLSHGAAELLHDRLPKDASLNDLGTYRLRDLSRPERIFQLRHPDLKEDFPPLRTLDTYRHNLPPQRTSFVGRQHEMDDIRSLLQDSSLVTLTGAGGCGKTRLALQVAASLIDDYPDGVFIADLSRVIEPKDVEPAVARAFGLSEDASNNVAPFLRDKTMLLVLDNCEHLISTCAELCDTLLEAAPGLRILATSREPIRVSGESTYLVPSLPVPPERDVAGIDGLTPYAATELFLDRARRIRSDFALSEVDASSIANICRRLDGIPLAVELAAARVRVLSPQQIADALDERFRVLTGGTRTAMPRQQTLTASVDWSHDLLTEPERILFRRLSVFQSGFTLEACADVCSGPGVEPHQVLDLLSLLVDKSLVEVDTSAGAKTRYRLLETIRQYAADRLTDAGEEEQTRERFRDHFLRAAERHAEEVWGPHGVDAFQAFLDDRENYEAAFRWTCSREDFEHAARFLAALAESLENIWLGEARAWITALIPHIERVPEPIRTDGIHGAARHLPKALFPNLEPIARESVEFHRTSGDERRLGRSLLVWARLSHPNDDSSKALDEAIGLAKKTDTPFALACVQSSAALLSTSPEKADRYAEELIESLRQNDAPIFRLRVAWFTLYSFMFRDPLRALEVGELQAHPDLERIPHLHRHARTWRAFNLALVGRLGEARELANELIPHLQQVGDMNCLSMQHRALSVAADVSGDSDTALAEYERSRLAHASAGSPTLGPELGLAWMRLGRGETETADSIRRTGAQWESDPRMGPELLLLDAAITNEQGDLEEAEHLAHSALGGLGHYVFSLTGCLELLAAIAAGRGNYIEAARILGAVEGHRNRVGLAVRNSFFRDLYARTLASIKEALEEDAFHQAWNEGTNMNQHEIVSYVQRGRGERGRPSAGWQSLTPTEEEVAKYVAEGLSNKEIAERMFVSVRTVTTHLTHIYEKLGFSSRPELVSAAARRSAT